MSLTYDHRGCSYSVLESSPAIILLDYWKDSGIGTERSMKSQAASVESDILMLQTAG
jgi:hypothetical protein